MTFVIHYVFYIYSNRCRRKQLFMTREKHEKYFENFVEWKKNGTFVA